MIINLYNKRHAACLLEIYSYYVSHSVYTFDLVPPDLDEFDQKLQHYHLCLVAYMNEKVIGYAYASQHRPKKAYETVCETGIYMDKDFKGAGHGTSLYQVLLNLLESMGYYTALGGLTVPNPGSEKLHAKLGFSNAMCYENIGYKLGAWRSVDWWRKDLRSFDDPPVDLKSVDQLSPEEFNAILTSV